MTKFVKLKILKITTILCCFASVFCTTTYSIFNSGKKTLRETETSMIKNSQNNTKRLKKSTKINISYVVLKFCCQKYNEFFRARSRLLNILDQFDAVCTTKYGDFVSDVNISDVKDWLDSGVEVPYEIYKAYERYTNVSQKILGVVNDLSDIRSQKTFIRYFIGRMLIERLLYSGLEVDTIMGIMERYGIKSVNIVLNQEKNTDEMYLVVVTLENSNITEFDKRVLDEYDFIEYTQMDLDNEDVSIVFYM